MKNNCNSLYIYFNYSNINHYFFSCHSDSESICVSGLHLRIAAQLQALGLPGERALLLYPAGLDFWRC